MRSGWSVLLAIGASAAVVAIASKRWGPSGTDASEHAPNQDVNKDKTTKSQRGTQDVKLETASPTGHEEIEQHIAVESQGRTAPPEKQDLPKESRQARKNEKPDQPLNPRRTRNARPE